MLDQPRLPIPVATAIEAWLGHHDRIAPGVVEGLYLVGSVVLDDWTPRSDIDVVAFVSDPTDAEVIERLAAAHEAYGADGGRPSIDGPFLSLADVSVAPVPVQRPWSLDGEFRFDGDCFEINPVTWFTLAERSVGVRGPSPDLLGVYVDDAERLAWVRGNVDTYWRSVRADVLGALEREPDRTEFAADMVDWCVLGAARMWFTIATGGVASKGAAGVWAAQRLPAHREVIDLATAIRSGATVGHVGRDAAVATVTLMGAVIAEVV